MIQQITRSLMDAHKALDTLISNKAVLREIESAANILIESLKTGNRIFSCGNGGSMCDAMHFAEELTGRYRKDRKAYPAMAINDPGHLTCVANDYGYDYIFSRYLEAHGREKDTIVAITTSGKSKTVLNAATTAKSMGMRIIVLTGHLNPDLKEISDAYICTAAEEFADRIQELHIKVLHILIELIERHFHPEIYKKA